MFKKLNILAATMATLLVSSSAYAIQFDGFLTAGATRLDDKDQDLTAYQGITNDTRFDVDSRFGLQISSDISEDMTAVAQLLATGSDENFNAIIEWAYADYTFNDILSVRGGKIKEPVFLISDYVEVGYAYPWIRPPAEVYSMNPLNTVNGVELLIQFPIGRNTLSFQPYMGTNSEDIPGTNGAGQFEAVDIKGIDIKFSGRGFTVHASSLKTNVATQGVLITDAAFAPPAIESVGFDLDAEGNATLTSAGFTVDIANVVVYAEWQDRDIEGSAEALFTDQDSSYITVGYRFGQWMPHITLATIDGKAPTALAAVTCADPTGCASLGGAPFGATVGAGQFPYAEQTSTTLGLRYEVNDSAALKIEHQIVDIESEKNTASYQNFGLFDPSFASAASTEKVGITSIALDVIF